MSFSDAEIDAAVEALSEPGRLTAAQDLVSRAVPGLQRILGAALSDGGWFDIAHQAALGEAIGTAELEERDRAVRTLLAEETRLTMLVGVAVGFELARELGYAPAGSAPHPSRGTDFHAPTDTGPHQVTDEEN